MQILCCAFSDYRKLILRITLSFSGNFVAEKKPVDINSLFIVEADSISIGG